MAFDSYIFDREGFKELTDEKADNLKANRGLSDLLGFGLSVVAGRLAKDRLRYRDYGPYWWALKDLMNANGYDLGSETDEVVKAIYRGDRDVDTLIMADEFRELYLQTWVLYTNQFDLDSESGEMWTLYDRDMEPFAY